MIKLRQFIKSVLFRIIKKLYSILSRLPRNDKTVVFESFHGKQVSCNPRAIYEELKIEKPDYKLYWSINRKDARKFSHLKLNILPRFSFRWIYHMATAKYWVVNTRMPVWMRKPENTVFLQTWHGTPLKKLGLDIEDVKMPGTTTEKYRRNFIRESATWDYLIAPNEYSSNIFRKAFNFNNTMLETGYPRNDLLYTHNSEVEIAKIKMKNDIPVNKKVILYAPTWRDDEYIQVGKYKFSLKLDLDQLQKRLGDDYIILLRMHYLIADQLDLKNYEGFAFNFSDYEDIRELYLISDLLITDYSSVFYDYANLKRPVIFYTYDLEKYRDSLRGFYMDFENDAPGPLVTTTDELIKVVKTLEDRFDKMNRMNDFHEKYCAWDNGNASKQVIKEVFYK